MPETHKQHYYFNTKLTPDTEGVPVDFREARKRFLKRFRLFHPDRIVVSAQENNVELTERMQKLAHEVTKTANQIVNSVNESDTTHLTLCTLQLHAASFVYQGFEERLEEYHKILQVCLYRIEHREVHQVVDETTESKNNHEPAHNHLNLQTVSYNLVTLFDAFLERQRNVGQTDYRHIFDNFRSILLNIHAVDLNQHDVIVLESIIQQNSDKIREIGNYVERELLLKNSYKNIANGKILNWQQNFSSQLKEVLLSEQNLRGQLAPQLRILQKMW